MSQRLTDLAPREAWEELERTLHQHTRLNCAAFYASGEKVTEYVNWGNALCQRIKENPQSRSAICAVANQHFIQQAKTTREPVLGECDAGLFKYCVPVFSNGTFLGIVGGCGCLAPHGDIDQLLIEKSGGLDVKTIRALSLSVATANERWFQDVCRFTEEQIRQIAQRQ